MWVIVSYLGGGWEGVENYYLLPPRNSYIYEEPASAQPIRLGKGQKRGRKKEAIVTTGYTIAPHPRTPQQVVDSFFHRSRPDQKEKVVRAKPQNKHIRATLDGKDAALDRLRPLVTAREGAHIQHRVVLCDGCEALQILSGQTAQVIAKFRQMVQTGRYSAAQRSRLTKTANYFERNLACMDYPTHLKHGWPIASGVIEGACRHFVKDRCELSGMRWEQAGVENLLRLRAVAENDDWDDYHPFRKRQRHLRLYRAPYPEQSSAEFQALEPNSVRPTRPPTSVGQVEPTVSYCAGSDHYHHLPLAA